MEKLKNKFNVDERKTRKYKIVGMSAKLTTLIFILIISKQVCKSNKIYIESESGLNSDKKLLLNCVMNIIDTHSYNTVLIFNKEEDNFEGSIDKVNKKLIDSLDKKKLPKVLNSDIDTKSIQVLAGKTLSIKYFYDCRKLSGETFDNIDVNINYVSIILNYSEHCATTLQEVAHKVGKYDVTFIIKRSDDDFDILTFIPKINASTCVIGLDHSASNLGSCKDPGSGVIFPEKTPGDLMGCPLKIGVASFFPFINIKNVTTNDLMKPAENVTGADYEIVKIMAEKNNFTMKMYYVLLDGVNPVRNQTFLKYLLDGSVDICIGGHYRMYGDRVEYSGVYGRQAVVWMYLAERVNRSWQNLVVKVNGLYVFLLFYFCYSGIWYVFCMFDKRPVSFNNLLLYSWGALIGTSSLQEADNLKQKIINIFYLVLCLHLSAYIGIQMYSFLTIASPPTIYRTNEAIYKSGLKPYLIPTTKYFLQDNMYESFANTSRNCISFVDCEFLCLENNGITIVIDAQFAVFQTKTTVGDEARVLRVPENLLTVYHEMLFRKGTSIAKKFQNILVRLNEGGISVRLYHEAIGILLEAKAESASKNIMSFSYHCNIGCSITLSQSAGAFYLWLFGCGVSAFVFVLELAMKRQHQT